MPEAFDALRLGEVVLGAAALEGEAREVYLLATAGNEPALLAEARRRLSLAAALPDSFLALPAAEVLTASAGADDPSTDRFEVPSGGERYEILAEVGAGGSARVWKAHDRQLDRTVALKIFDAPEPGERRRFLDEAQAQARVLHDHVLEVYETGERLGVPFIAMRWVDGPGLMALASALSVEQKVRLVAQVAEGLHAAHREGLIHRDVKPSNILVERTPDGDWKPWIADFGIAERFREDGELRARVAGTPAYLAPELLAFGAAPLDRRVDVWGLGVTLYELLTGRRPFAAATVPELLSQVASMSPTPLRQVVPTLPAELEAIVLRCLEKDPERRYPSARALAADLRRFLDGEVVEAYTASLAYRLTKLVLRHRVLSAVAAVSAVLIAAALVLAALSGIEARRANRVAEMRRGQAEDLIGFLLTDLKDHLEPLGKLDLLDGVGEQARRYFAAVPESELRDGELARRSQALYQLGDLRLRRGDLAGALPPLTESLALAQALAGREPDDPERLFGLGQSHFWVGHVFWEEGDLEKARPHFERYLELSRRLVALRPESLDDRLELSYALSNLGSLERQQGKLEAALGLFELTLAAQQGLVAADSSEREWRFELAATHDLVAESLAALGRLAEARPHLETLLELRQALVREEPDNFRYRQFLGTAHDSMENWLEAGGDVVAALQQARAADLAFSALVAHDSENQLWRWQRELARLKRGYLLVLGGEAADGAALLREVGSEAAGRIAASPNDRRWRLLAARAALHLGQAKVGGQAAVEGQAGVDGAAEARADLRRGTAMLQALAGEDPNDTDALRWLAQGLLLAGRLEPRAEDAALRWREAETRLAGVVTENSPAALRAARVAVWLELGEREQALPWARRLMSAGYRHPEFLASCRAAAFESPTAP